MSKAEEESREYLEKLIEGILKEKNASGEQHFYVTHSQRPNIIYCTRCGDIKSLERKGNK